MNDEEFIVANLDDDDDEPDPEVLGASQLQDTSMPWTPTQKASGYTMSVQQVGFQSPCLTRALDALTYLEHHV
jgi:hypothetical protein